MGTNTVLVIALVVVGCGGPGSFGDDAPPGAPVLGFDMATSSYDETDGELTINFLLSEPADDVITFWVDIGGSTENGSDYYGGASGIALIPPSAELTWLTLTLVEDGEPEPAETIELSLSACSWRRASSPTMVAASRSCRLRTSSCCSRRRHARVLGFNLNKLMNGLADRRKMVLVG